MRFPREQSVLQHILTANPDTVWELVRDFNNYPRYIEGVVESRIEDDKPGDAVGAVRKFRMGSDWIRQRLIGLSDATRTFTYAGCDPFPFPDAQRHADKEAEPAPIDYDGTLRLTPVVDGNRTFIEWWLTFECSPQDARRWERSLVELILQWVGSLEQTLDAAR